jgi:hypothetical protein
MMKFLLRQLGLVSLLATTGLAFDYAIYDPGVLVLSDVNTGISPIVTIFKGDEFNVTVQDIGWEPAENATDSDTLFWTTFINGNLAGNGTVSLADIGRELPTKIPVGTYLINDKGTADIVVTLTLDGVNSTTSGSYQVYAAGLSIVPLIVILVLAMGTRMVCT